MNHGFEIVFENTKDNQDLLKHCIGHQCKYSNTVLSLKFTFDYEFYLENMNECIKILNDNNINYLKIQF